VLLAGASGEAVSVPGTPGPEDEMAMVGTTSLHDTVAPAAVSSGKMVETMFV
jgi:hypothetical protein